MQRCPLARPFSVLAVLAVAVAAPSSAAAAVLGVVSTAPVKNTTAPATTSITINFDRAVTLGALGGGNFRVFGRGTGT